MGCGTPTPPPPETPTQEAVAKLWTEALKLSEIDINSMFLDIVDQVHARILLILGLLDEVTNADLKLPKMLTLHVKCKTG